MTNASTTKLVLLGSGTPNAEPDRAGSAAAIVTGGHAYLIDFGPGVVRRANQASQSGLDALAPARLTTAFLTHLHSDHTIGLPDLILTPWTLGRTRPLRLFGPPGLRTMVMHTLAAYQADIRERLDGLEPANPDGWRVDVTEISAGWVFEDERVRVEAFSARHGGWPAFGYRFRTADADIVVSGDTAPHPGIAAAYAHCDILLHEVYSAERWQHHPETWRQYHAGVHTATTELARIAGQARPGLLVLYHQLGWGQSPEGLVREIVEAGYAGPIVYGRDLDVFEPDHPLPLNRKPV